MLLLILLMVIVCSCIVWAGCSIQLGGVQIMIMAVIGLITTGIVKAICEESVIALYEEKKKEKVEDKLMLSFDIIEILGDWPFIPIIIYAIASGSIIKRLMGDFSFGNTGLIKPIIFLLIAEIILVIGCLVCIENKAIPVVLYLEADVLNKTILLLAGILLMAFVAGLYIFFGIAMIGIFLGSSFGGG